MAETESICVVCGKPVTPIGTAGYGAQTFRFRHHAREDDLKHAAMVTKQVRGTITPDKLG